MYYIIRSLWQGYRYTMEYVPLCGKMTFALKDYVFEIYPTGSKVYNTDGEQEWAGYHVILRYGLWEYESTGDYDSDMPFYVTFALRDFGRGSPDIVDARIETHPLSSTGDYSTFSSMNLSYIDPDVYNVRDPTLLLHAVNLMLRQAKRPTISVPKEELKAMPLLPN